MKSKKIENNADAVKQHNDGVKINAVNLENERLRREIDRLQHRNQVIEEKQEEERQRMERDRDLQSESHIAMSSITPRTPIASSVIPGALDDDEGITDAVSTPYDEQLNISTTSIPHEVEGRETRGSVYM